MERVTPLLRALWRGIVRIWRSGRAGKIGIVVGALLIYGCLAAPFTNSNRSAAPTATAVAAASVVTSVPTDIPPTSVPTNKPTEAPTNTPAPTLSPTPEVTETPTTVPTEVPPTDVPPPTIDPGIAARKRYREELSPKLLVLADGLTEMGRLVNTPQSEIDAAWALRLNTTTDQIQQAHRDIALTRPVPGYESVHNRLVAATMQCDRAAGKVRDGVRSGDAPKIQEGLLQFNDCNIKFKQVEPELSELLKE